MHRSMQLKNFAVTFTTAIVEHRVPSCVLSPESLSSIILLFVLQ